MRNVILTILILGLTAGFAQAQEITRKQLQLKIRESISEEEFSRMVEIRQRTGKSWSDIFDYTIEPEREEVMKNRRSLRSYIVDDEEPARRGPQGEGRAIDVNAAAGQDIEEKPLSVKEEPQPDRRQRLYNKDGQRPVVEDEEEATDWRSIPATSVRARLQAARAAEADQAKAREDGAVRKSRLYRSNGRPDRDADESGDEPGEESGERGFGADVLDQYESKIFGKREDRFKGFGSKKDPERKMFRSGTISNNDRKTSMFGKDDEEEK